MRVTELNKGAWGSPQQARTWDIQVHACHQGIRAFFMRSRFFEIFQYGGEKVNSEDQKKLQKSRPGVFVRLSEYQRSLLEKDALLLGWSLPSVLRENYFKRLPLKVVFDKEGEGKFLAEFKRIGNNINQLARSANTGEIVKHTDLAPIREQLKIIYLYIMRIDGNHKNTSK